MSKSKNKKKFSTIIILVLIFVLLISFVSGYFLLSYQRKKFNEQVETLNRLQSQYDELKNKFDNTKSIREEIKQISELSTLEYNYTGIIEVRDPNMLWKITLPFGGTYFVCTFEATVKVGIKNAESIEINEERDENNIIQCINVNCPKSSILSHETSNYSVYSEEGESKQVYVITELDEKRENVKKEHEQKLIDNGYFEKSDQQTQALIESWIQLYYGQAVKINFTFVE